MYRHYVENDFLATVRFFFVGAAGDGAAPTVACSGAQRPAAPTNGRAGTVGHTSYPYKWVRFVGAAYSPAAPGIAICRGG